MKMLDRFTALGFEQLFTLNHVRSLDENVSLTANDNWNMTR